MRSITVAVERAQRQKQMVTAPANSKVGGRGVEGVPDSFEKLMERKSGFWWLKATDHFGGNPPNKSHVAAIIFDKFGSIAWPLFGASFIKSEKIGANAWPLLGCGHY